MKLLFFFWFSFARENTINNIRGSSAMWISNALANFFSLSLQSFGDKKRYKSAQISAESQNSNCKSINVIVIILLRKMNALRNATKATKENGNGKIMYSFENNAVVSFWINVKKNGTDHCYQFGDFFEHYPWIEMHTQEMEVYCFISSFLLVVSEKLFVLFVGEKS